MTHGRRHATSRMLAAVSAALLAPLADAQAPQPSAAVAAASPAPEAGAPAPASSTATTLLTGYDGGFCVRTADGRAELRIGGLIQLDAVHYGARRTPDSELDVRRMRLEFELTFDETLHVLLEPNFLPDGTEMEEAKVALDLRDGLTSLEVGRAKAPFGLEEVRSRRWIDFPRFSLLNQFSPAEDHGVFVRNTGACGKWRFDAAVYNGTGDADSNSSKDVAARFGWRPLATSTFELGLAATRGSQDASADDHPIHDEVGRDVTSFAPGVRFDGTRERIGIDALWSRGPFFAQAEWLHMSEELANGGTDSDVVITGAYVDVSYVLTGEERGDGRVTPSAPFDLRTGAGRGAWVLAARASELRFDDDLDTFATPGTFTDRIRSLSLGLNWFANDHLLVRNAWTHSFYSDAVDVDARSVSDEDAFTVELQVSF